MAKKKPAESDQPESFEESLAELEAIVGDLEGGELGLGDALGRYEEGVRHLKQCHAQLERAERKIELLSGFDADGNPVTVPFDDSATADDHDAASRSKKRSSTPPAAGKTRGPVDDRTRLF
jgi:exodeoxyribonuclease VII small subunit